MPVNKFIITRATCPNKDKAIKLVRSPHCRYTWLILCGTQDEVARVRRHIDEALEIVPRQNVTPYGIACRTKDGVDVVHKSKTARYPEGAILP